MLPMLKTPRMLSSIVLWQGSPAVFPVCRQQHWLTTGRATCKLMQPLLLLVSLAVLALKALTDYKYPHRVTWYACLQAAAARLTARKAMPVAELATDCLRSDVTVTHSNTEHWAAAGSSSATCRPATAGSHWSDACHRQS